MMRIFMFSGLVAVGMAVSASAMAADATPTGVEVGLRTGYALPLGAATGGGTNGSNDLSKVFSGVIPIWVDAGYRLNPNIYIGAFFQYGIGLVNTSSDGAGAACSQSGVSCSASDMMFGIDAHYHLMPDQTIDPWVGLGLGYEIANFSASQGGQSAGTSFSGFQFVNVQVGADYKVMPNLGVGPFVMFSLGQYGSCGFSGALSSQSCTIQQTAMHEWLTFGIKGNYDINL